MNRARGNIACRWGRPAAVPKAVTTWGLWLLVMVLMACAADLQTLKNEANDPRAWVRADAMDRLGRLQGPEIRSLILPALKDPDADVRRRAIRALARHARPEDGRYFTRALNDPDWQVRYEANQALASVGQPSAEALIYQLQTTEGAARLRVIEALGRQGDRRATPHLVRILSVSSDDSVTQAAAKALGALKDPAAVDPLVALLTQRVAHSRYAALDALVSIGEPSLAALLPLLTHPDPDTAGFVVAAIGRIGSATSMEALHQAIMQSPHDEIRVASMAAMGKIGDAQSLERLIDYLDQGDPPMVAAAQKAISQRGASAVTPLVVVLEAGACGDCRTVLETLGLLGGGAVEALVAALETASPEVRKDLRQVLIDMDASSVQPLLKVLAEQDDPLTHPAADILPAIGKAAVAPLLAYLAKDPEEPPEWARQMLVAVGEPAVAPLIEALAGENQSLAADLLAAIGEPAVLPLIAVLDQENANLRLAAARILGKIGDVRAAAPLVSAMANWFVGPGACEALLQMGWLPTTDVQKIHYWVGRRDADQLLANWSMTRDILYGYLASGIKEQLEYAVYALIGLGQERALGPLLHTLNTTGYQALSLVFRASRQPKLAAAGLAWAEARGLDVELSSEAGFVKWGEMSSSKDGNTAD